MPDPLAVTGGITKALLDAFDQLHTSISAGLVGPDGTPSKTAVYMHLPVGQPVDPKMYADPWTPAGNVYTPFRNDGAFAAPPPPTAEAIVPPAQQLAKVPEPDPTVQRSINSAFNTARRVDDMLMVTNNGVAVAWPQRTVSIEYWAALQGMQAEPVPDPPQDVKDRLAAAEKTLYIHDESGNLSGYTPLYVAYRRNQKALADARSEYGLAYAQATIDPAAGQMWPITSSKYQTAVDQAYNDLRDMGGQQIEDAINTLQSAGGSAAGALIAKARKLYDDYSVGLAGAVATKVPWSYIDPVSWWDHNNSDMGIIRITADSHSYDAGGASNSHDSSSSFYKDSSSSNSGSVGFTWIFSIGANAGHTESQHDDGSSSSQSGGEHHEDASSDGHIEFEYFMASIERPWLLGDLFHMDGWYMVGQKEGAISDGTIEGQIGDVPKLLPMIPKSFVIVRNVKITSKSWGSMGDSLRNASTSSTGHTDASSTTVGGSVGWFGLGGSYQHTDSDASGAFGNTADSDSHWSYHESSTGGTLELRGSQIVGWVGQIQPNAPRKADPNLGKAPAPAAAPADPAATPAPAPAPAAGPPAPAPQL